jgi:Endoplasmic reticulum-based factor for assembly of V-ATPase
MVVIEVTPKVAAFLENAGVEVENCKFVHHATLLVALRGTYPGEEMQALRDILQRCKVYRNNEDAMSARSGPLVRSTELEARLSLLRAQIEEREYAAMVADVAATSSSSALTESARLGNYGSQMSIGANVIVSMATCFVAGYFAFKHSSGSDSVGLAGGLVCMAIAMAVEATLVITRLYSIESAAEKEKRSHLKYIAARRHCRQSSSLRTPADT